MPFLITWESELILVSVENTCLSQHVFGVDMILNMHTTVAQGGQLSWQLMVVIHMGTGLPMFKLHFCL